MAADAETASASMPPAVASKEQPGLICEGCMSIILGMFLSAAV